MSMLAKHLSLVKEQMEFHQRMVGRYTTDPFRVALHNATAAKFQALEADLLEADEMLDRPATLATQAPSNGVMRLALIPKEVEGLPEELLKELSISDGDKTEFTILSIIEEGGGIATLDRIIIGLYRKTGEIFKRPTLTSRLYRMAQKDLVFSVPTKKGVYSDRPISEDEAVLLFSGEELSEPT
jgi:hypothetical protein